ncbi:ABC transporter permease [Paenibacillus sp. FJAT-27812]|uniref:ABC transporter permease n=1 Tax=Paenibacillus sp. FJAT-27812 TaxID=1684143 RepID=UPI0006A78C90|nr:ABC transporter permease [Paenibacillus sp. FJAT-27812]
MSSAPMQLRIKRPASLFGAKRLLTELDILFRIQFALIRDSWIIVVLVATIFPLTTILFMRFFIADPSPEMMVQIIAGNMIFGVIIMGLNSIGQEISMQKHQGHFTFYASLPILKINFVAANLLRGLMSTIPSFVLLGVIGYWIYGVDLHLSWGLPLVMLLSLTSVVGLGVCIGFWSPNQQLTNMLAQLLMMVVTFLSPVMVERDQLPEVLQWISYIFPTTYAADAMRIVLLHGWTQAVMLDCLVMLLYTFITLFIVNRLVSWRV